MQKIRTAIFGAGFGNYGHLQTLLKLSEYEVIAVCGSRFAAQENIKIYSSDDWLALITENKIDLAVIAVPPEKQTAILLECLKRKIGVMVEKPLCLKQSEYEEILKQSQIAKVNSAASFIFPELETWKKAKNFLETEALGPLRTIYFDWKIESQAIKNHLVNWKSSTASGGSALFHFVPHVLHALQFFAGPIEKLSCISIPARDLGSKMGSPLCSIQMLMANQVLVSINCSLAAPLGSGQIIEMNGARGSLILENKGVDYVRGFKLKLQTLDSNFEMLESETNPHLRADLDSRTAPLTSIYQKYANSLANNTKMQPSLTEALDVQRLILLSESSHKQMKWLETKL